MDFNKWNSHMRHRETDPMFEDFDHLFGLERCFKRTHDMFSHSQMYLANESLLPEVCLKSGKLVDGPTVWSDHLGGVEGLRQKGWTIFTVAILRFVCDNLGVSCEIMGQGDNQVLIVTYSEDIHLSYKEQHSRFLDHLEAHLSTIGPPLKRWETFSSSNFFTYGKYPVYKSE